MHRNKLPLLIAVFVFAAVFIIGIFARQGHWRYDKLIYIGGQTGLGLSILAYLLIKDKNKEHERE